MTWLVVSLLLTAAVMALVAPFRPGFIEQMLTTPRFSIESLLGIIVCVAIARAAFEMGIPDIRSEWRRARVALGLLAIWLALFVIATVAPVLPPSMLGKRGLCNLEVIIYAIPLTTAGILLIRRMMPLRTSMTGAWTGFAAGLIPAYLMQLACMHEPWHNIIYHLLPTVGAALIGALLGRLLLENK